MPRSNYRGRVLRDVFQGLHFIQSVTSQADSGLLKDKKEYYKVLQTEEGT